MSKAYPKYKPSGVEWLGDVPEHWETKKFNYMIGFQEGPGIMAVDFLDEGVPLLRIRNIQSKTIDLDGCNFLDPAKVSEKWNHFRCKKGDLLISGSASTGLICEVIDAGIGSIPYTGIIRLWPGNKSINKNYIRWVVSSDQFNSQISIFQAGSTIKHFGPEHLRKMKITIPPLPEQQAIVAFLDRETGRIDALIAKKERLLELLAEQRTALISRAVTKGLDASVKLKSSGVEWLGDVPEHWGVKRLKYCVSLVTTKAGSSGSNPIALENIESWTGRFLETESEFEGEGIRFQKDDVLFGKLRPYLAKVYLAEKNGESVGDIFVLRPAKETASKYVSNVLRTDNYIEIIDGSTYGSKMPRASWEFMGCLPFLLPPLPEQQAIAEFLDRETAKIDALSAKVTTVIERLKEYRTALISSAVTGKIDVREAV